MSMNSIYTGCSVTKGCFATDNYCIARANCKMVATFMYLANQKSVQVLMMIFCNKSFLKLLHVHTHVCTCVFEYAITYLFQENGAKKTQITKIEKKLSQMSSVTYCWCDKLTFSLRSLLYLKQLFF
jgi:hypothetical protein